MGVTALQVLSSVIKITLIRRPALFFRLTFSSMAKEGDRETRPQFGTRFLTDEESPFKHNAWDHVEWDSEQIEQALQKVQENSKTKLNESDKEKHEKKACEFWNLFYGVHQNRFFKDRNWLFTEFPELDSADQQLGPDSKSKINMLEVGCGVGNTVFPVLQNVSNQNFFIYACDFSEAAISILKEHSLYDENRCSAFVCDVTSEDWDPPFKEETLDIATLIFVLSAISPEKMKHVVQKLKKYLKPGGLVLFRDYGRYDLAQLRFKTGRCISDNFYVRGDGTRAYFFTQEDVHDLFCDEGFIEEQNIMNRMLQVNRGKLLKMYRSWIQAKYRKSLDS